MAVLSPFGLPCACLADCEAFLLANPLIFRRLIAARALLAQYRARSLGAVTGYAIGSALGAWHKGVCRVMVNKIAKVW